MYQGTGKGTNVTSKEGEIYQGKGRGRMSRVKNGRYIRCKDGTCIRCKEREVSAG